MNLAANATLLRNWKLPAVALLLMLAASPAFGVPVVVPSGTLTVDGNPVSIPIGLNPGSGLWGIGTWDSELDDFTGFSVSSAEFSADISGVIDPDPMISYGISVTDFGAPSVFGFFFSTPTVPVIGANTVTASVAGRYNRKLWMRT